MPYMKKLKKLPDDLAEFIPTYGPDPRQESFFRSEHDDVVFANTREGFPAANVNLGFLQWMAVIAHIKGMSERDALKAVVGFGVQRVETITVSPHKGRKSTYDVRFTAYDDFGRSSYLFEVDFNRDYPIPEGVLKQFSIMEEEEKDRD